MFAVDSHVVNPNMVVVTVVAITVVVVGVAVTLFDLLIARYVHDTHAFIDCCSIFSLFLASCLWSTAAAKKEKVFVPIRYRYLLVRFAWGPVALTPIIARSFVAPPSPEEQRSSESRRSRVVRLQLPLLSPLLSLTALGLLVLKRRIGRPLSPLISLARCSVHDTITTVVGC